jgi:mycofactocin system transcriptional regulator
MTSPSQPHRPGDRGGRRAATTAHEIAEVAQRLFLEHGFEEVSVEEIAAAAGIGRRTFFRYFATKVDVLFVESDREVAGFRACLAAAPADEPWELALRRATVEALRLPPGQEEWARQRAQLVLSVPRLRAHASTVFTVWQRIASDFAADRLGLAGTDLLPLSIGYTVLAATLVAHEHWIAHPGTELDASLEAALDAMLPGVRVSATAVEPDALRP